MKTYLTRLEFDKITQYIEKYCVTYSAKEMAVKMLPAYDAEKVNTNLQETNAAVSYIYSYGNIPIDRIENVDIFIKTLESGSSISAKALLEIAKILNISKSLKDYYYSADLENNINLKILEKYFSNLYYNEDISKRIFNSIIDEDTISDNASPKLSSLSFPNKFLSLSLTSFPLCIFK